MMKRMLGFGRAGEALGVRRRKRIVVANRGRVMGMRPPVWERIAIASGEGEGGGGRGDPQGGWRAGTGGRCCWCRRRCWNRGARSGGGKGVGGGAVWRGGLVGNLASLERRRR